MKLVVVAGLAVLLAACGASSSNAEFEQWVDSGLSKSVTADDLAESGLPSITPLVVACQASDPGNVPDAGIQNIVEAAREDGVEVSEDQVRSWLRANCA